MSWLSKKIGGLFNDVTGASEANEWQERMSNTAHQRQVADLMAAGLNPALSATGGSGASTPSASSGNHGLSGMSALVNSATNIGTAVGAIRKAFADASNAEAQADAIKFETDLKRKLLDDEGDGSETLLDKFLGWNEKAGKWLGDNVGKLIGNGLGYGTPTEDVPINSAYNLSLPSDPKEAKFLLQREMNRIYTNIQELEKEIPRIKDVGARTSAESRLKLYRKMFKETQDFYREKYNK